MGRGVVAPAPALDLVVLVCVVCRKLALAVDVDVNVRVVLVGRRPPIELHKVVQPVSQAVCAVPSGAELDATACTLQEKLLFCTPPAASR
jgi:hypothetical protein